jgi:hypothetical protein
MNSDTPLPQEEPGGENPPDGAIIDYYLKENANNSITLEIKDSSNKVIRTFRSDDKPYDIPPVNIPLYWIRPQQILPATAGSHRFLWDLHYTPLPEPANYPIAAIFGNTAPVATSPWVMPGKYDAVLNINGKSYSKSFYVKMDPRVKTSIKDLKQQHDLALACYNARIQAAAYLDKINGHLKNASKETEQELSAFAGKSQGRRRGGSAESNFNSLMSSFDNLLHNLEETDAPPTEQLIEGVTKMQEALTSLEKKWEGYESKTFH